MTRVAVYTRYSSELQSERSIEDQLALCRDRADAEGWDIVETFADYALSGATMERPGLRDLIGTARSGGIDILLTESLDRLSRDQEDIAGLYKRLTAWQVEIITLSEGKVSELHIGLKGTMNALFLKDLAAKSLRGQLGKARAGLAAGGIPYGYEALRQLGQDGEVERGKRRIVPDRAAVIRRIFEEFAAGRSSVAIAKGLNADGVPSPRGGSWNPSTIHGHRTRGVGILHNPLYVGRQVFNRHAVVRDPDTGARQKGICANKRTMAAPAVEKRILDGLRDRLMEPDLVQAFVEEYHAELQRRQKDARRKRRAAEKERAGIERQIARLVDAIAEGAAANVTAVGTKLRGLEERLSRLTGTTDETALIVEWHPNAVDIYKNKIADLRAALTADSIIREEATAALPGLVDRIVAYPAEKRGQFDLELHGHLAAALNMGKHGNGGGGRGIRTLDTG